MVHLNQSELLLAVLASAVVGGIFARQVYFWWRSQPVSPDPWDAEVEKSLQEPKSMPVCHRCFTPHADDVWFCSHCGAAVGNYNNWIPYVNLFSEGEVFRNGVSTRISSKPFVVVGYLFYSAISYLIFAPIYWYFLFKNLRRIKEQRSGEEEMLAEV